MINYLQKYIKIHSNDSDRFIRDELSELLSLITTSVSTEHDFSFEPGMKVYMSGFAGLAGTDHIIRYHSEMIPAEYQISDPEITNCNVFTDGVFTMQAGERGIFQTLFELHKISNMGFEIHVRNIPVSPKTIEICEYLGLNPYKLLSSGSMIYVVPEKAHMNDIERIVFDSLDGKAVFPVLIGNLTISREMKLITGDSVSLLNKPGRDELLKIFETGTQI